MAQVACDSLLLLCDKADVLLELYPSVPSKIIQVRSIIFSLRVRKMTIFYILFIFHLDLVGYTRTNDNAGKARASDSVDAVLSGRVGDAFRTGSVTAGVPREAAADDLIHS